MSGVTGKFSYKCTEVRTSVHIAFSDRVSERGDEFISATQHESSFPNYSLSQLLYSIPIRSLLKRMLMNWRGAVSRPPCN